MDAMKKKKYLGIGLLFVCCFLAGRTAGKLQAAFCAYSANDSGGGKLAVIIDDFGYNGAGTAEMLALDIPFTAAVLPFSSHTAENAAQAAEAGKEVIIHMPMESLTGKPEWVGGRGCVPGHVGGGSSAVHGGGVLCGATGGRGQ